MERKSNPPPVELGDLRKSFGNQKVLDGISLSVPKGQTVAVLGRSGTGKSVLLKLLVGLQKPDSGSVRIGGEEITDLEPSRLSEVRKQIGFLFQQGALYDSLTVEENVAFPLTRHAGLTGPKLDDKVHKLLSKVGLSDADFKKAPSEISGGMQKRVGLARALALDPPILLLDEPTAGLDPITATEISRLIVELKKERGITAVVVTHDMRGARIFADLLALLDEGHFAVQGSFDDLLKSKNEFAVHFLKDGGAAKAAR